MNKLVDKLFKGIDYFTGILTGLMVFFVFLNVVLRTFFNQKNWQDTFLYTLPISEQSVQCVLMHIWEWIHSSAE